MTHLKELTPEQQERKSSFIAYAVSKAYGADPKQIAREAAEKWDKENNI